MGSWVEAGRVLKYVRNRGGRAVSGEDSVRNGERSLETGGK